MPDLLSSRSPRPAAARRVSAHPRRLQGLRRDALSALRGWEALERACFFMAPALGAPTALAALFFPALGHSAPLALALPAAGGAIFLAAFFFANRLAESHNDFVVQLDCSSSPRVAAGLPAAEKKLGASLAAGCAMDRFLSRSRDMALAMAGKGSARASQAFRGDARGPASATAAPDETKAPRPNNVAPFRRASAPRR